MSDPVAWQSAGCQSPHCECDELARLHCSAKLMDRMLDYGRIESRILAAACETATSRTVQTTAPPVSGQGAQHECHEHGGVEQRGSVRRVLPKLSEGRGVDEDARYYPSSGGPAAVHAVARRCCELAGCRTGTCLACLATRQRHRPADDVPRSGDLVQREAAQAVIRHRAWVDWALCGWSKSQVDGLRLSSAGVSQASDR